MGATYLSPAGSTVPHNPAHKSPHHLPTYTPLHTHSPPYPTGPVVLRYVDGEGDLVTITSRQDLQAAFAEALKVGV